MQICGRSRGLGGTGAPSERSPLIPSAASTASGCDETGHNIPCASHRQGQGVGGLLGLWVVRRCRYRFASCNAWHVFLEEGGHLRWVAV